MLVVVVIVTMSLSVRCCFFFFKQKTAYELRISDWSSDVCSSDLPSLFHAKGHLIGPFVTVSMFALRREMVFLQQVENGNPAFLLNISIAPDDGLLVERNIYDARIGHWSSPLRGLRGKDQRQKTIHNLCPIYPQIGRAHV